MKNRLVHVGIITIFCALYFLVATISMINSVAFFDLAHTGLMNWALAIGFELGAAASLGAIIILEKTNKWMVWGLFLLLTGFQMMANSYHAFVNLEEYQGWIELFGLQDEEPIFQKRILSIVSGAVLPIVALGFIKSLTDYLKPEESDNVDDYYDSRNKHMVDIVENKNRRAENIRKANEELDQQIQHYIKPEKEEDESIDSLEEKELDPNDESVVNDNSELNVRVDEKTGTTYVTTNKSNPL